MGGVNIRVLSLSLDTALASRSVTPVQQRHMAYARNWDQFIVIARSKDPDKRLIHLDARTLVIPVYAKNRASLAVRMLRIALAVSKRHRVDVITVQDPFVLGCIGWFLGRIAGARLNVQDHSSFFGNSHWLHESRGNRFLHWIGTQVIRRAETVRTVNSAEAVQVQKLGVAPERIVTFPIVPDLIRPGLQPTPFWPVKPHLLYVGRLAKEKGVDVAIRALKRVRESIPLACLMIAGEGPEHQSLLRLVQHEGLQEAVQFVGHLSGNALHDLYKENSILLLPSQYEGFGRVLLEGGVLGLPIVATRTAGAVEVLGESYPYLSPIGDSDYMAGAIVRLLNSESLFKEACCLTWQRASAFMEIDSTASFVAMINRTGKV